MSLPERELALLQDETGTLVRTVDALDEERLAGASSLPGWSRAHVVAHLTLNAEGLAAAVEARRRGESVPQYASDRARDSDIEELARADLPALRDRFLASTTLLADALAAVRDDEADGMLERTAGGISFRVGEVPRKRLVEVTLHHVDLDAGHTLEDVSPQAAGEVVDLLAGRLGRLAPITVHAEDLDRRWSAGGGAGDRVARGSAARLAWWLSGRGTGEGLVLPPDLPPIRPW